MAEPSIAMIPSGYKAEKIYSVLPTNGNADLDFARTTTATRVNQNGLIEEVAIGVPRLDYTDGSCPSLLFEPTSTNEITQSQVFSGYSGSDVVVADDAIISPYGTLNGASVTDNNDLLSGNSQISQGVTVDVSSTYTFSFFAKKKGNDYIALRTSAFTTPANANSFFDLNLGTVVSQGTGHTSEIKDYGNGWYRCSVTFTTDTVDTSGNLQMRLSENGTSTTITRDGTNSIYMWGWQFEKQSFATSYIKTEGSTQTRLADTASKSGLENEINSEEGVLYAEISALYDNSTNDLRWISLNDSSTNNLVALYYYKATNTIGAQLRVGNVQVFRDDDITITSKTDFIKIAFKWKQDDVSIYVDGIKKASSTSVNSFNSGVLNRFGFDGGNQLPSFFGNCKDLRIYKIALTDAQLTTLTTI